MARDALRVELAFDDDLRRDAGVVGAGCHSVLWPHPVVAGERVHDRLVEAVAHVQVPVTFGGGSRMQKASVVVAVSRPAAK